MAGVYLDDEYYIRKDGEIIGHIEPSGEDNACIADMGIVPEEQGNGYATEAIAQFVDRAASRGCRSVTTTTVISPAMEAALRSNGFVQAEGSESNRFVKDL